MQLVRSFAVATFVVGRGIKPVAVEKDGSTAVFLFPDAARDVVQEYRSAKQVLEAMIEGAGGQS